MYGDYFNQLRNAPIGLVQYYINVFIPLYSQNLIVSPLLWNKWIEIGQMGVQYAVSYIKSTNVLMMDYVKKIISMFSYMCSVFREE